MWHVPLAHGFGFGFFFSFLFFLTSPATSEQDAKETRAVCERSVHYLTPQRSVKIKLNKMASSFAY